MREWLNGLAATKANWMRWGMEYCGGGDVNVLWEGREGLVRVGMKEVYKRSGTNGTSVVCVKR